MPEKERYTTNVDGKLLEDLKILAIRKKRTANVLLEEAIKDLLDKYKAEEKKNEYTEQEDKIIGVRTIHED
jgi:predicted transcriptional regulator